MTFEVVKNQINDTNNHEKYFNVDVQNKKYPSCYQYNILIMLAKRLIKREQETMINACKNRAFLDRKLAEKIVSE